MYLSISFSESTELRTSLKLVSSGKLVQLEDKIKNKCYIFLTISYGVVPFVGTDVMLCDVCALFYLTLC